MKTGEEHFKDYKEYLEQNKMQGAGLSLMAAAFSNYAPAQAILGRYHLLGEVFPKDLPNALKWLEKAVELLTKAIELGNGEALFVRGVCSEKGIGVEKSAEDAKNWYAKAAEKGVTSSALMA